ncbi:hypothetical protein M413DRAFT_18499 [Hebeloma cylindrosporum]|uniref:Pentacotripeptide-repeat region of PRORP domain-containing protein n=1 Tax=Hebeloma cylindrosporum TaxID=76867 RepID=A0A0C2XYQ5_HEBCY|nr:hypothetical protein M413DRAFT_18499 [Hebeloma cylindrosporum h7]
MLPHILHSTTRAVAVVHNQTHTFRNVLQLQSSGPSSGSGSNRGNGAGSGSSKYNAGSRFYSGYNSAGRAVTQANAITSQDGQFSQSDDTEDFVLSTPKRPSLPQPQRQRRMRSSSVSLGVAGRTERGEKMGVLKTVQLHARSNHIFSSPETLASAKERLLADPIAVVAPTSPLRIRRNSTSTPLSPIADASSAPHLPPTPPPDTTEEAKPTTSTSSTESHLGFSSPKAKESVVVDPSAPQTVTPPPSPRARPRGYVQSFKEAKGDVYVIASLVRRLVAHPSATVEDYNAGLNALIESRKPGETLNGIIKVYNSMLEKSLLPNITTYELLINALTLRDSEVHKAIIGLEVRGKRSVLFGRQEVATQEADRARIEVLKTEDNISAAVSLFEGVLAIGGAKDLPANIFLRLLSSCAIHADVDSALHIFAQLESVKQKIPTSAYMYLLLTFSNKGRIEDAEEVFRSFREAGQANTLLPFPIQYEEHGRHAIVKVWNAMMEAYFRANMPDKAVELIDQIVSSTAPNNFTAKDVPIPTSSAFTTVIAGFISTGDIQSALAWFDKLLLLERGPENPFEGFGGKPMRPNSIAWQIMIDALATHGKLDDLNRIYKMLKSVCKEDNIMLRGSDHKIIFTLNMNLLPQLDDAAAIETLHFLLADLAEYQNELDKLHMKTEICVEFIKRGQYEVACNTFTEAIMEDFSQFTEDVPIHKKLGLQRQVETIMTHVYTAVNNGVGELPFMSALTLVRLASNFSLTPALKFAPCFLHAYGETRKWSRVPYAEMFEQDWGALLAYAVQLEVNTIQGNLENIAAIPNFAFNGLVSLLEDIAAQGMAFDLFDVGVRNRVLELLDGQYGAEKRVEILTNLGPSYLQASNEYNQLKYAALEEALSPAEPPSVPDTTSHVSMENLPALTVDPYFSKQIEETLRFHPERVVLDGRDSAYALFQEGVRRGVAPHIHTVARMIQGYGRSGHLDIVRELYTAAQALIPSYPENKRIEMWAFVEDAMIIALAHAGHIDAAHVHRIRLLDQGATPSSDAYGVLIQNVKDTTDDTLGGLALFHEALERGVQPNLYLYNNIISKLSKARKADYALELFQQMKVSGIKPSSITYGAVIGACARVGDVTSARTLFAEMINSSTFKPRVPPYNTMMQLYTTTKPSRVSVLYYYGEMKKAKVRPSAHTYKLLLDAYGSIEPVQLKEMEATFEELQKDKGVQVTGTHYASLINAYGCVAKNFDKAISVFESMDRSRGAPPPDAVVFEAVINVLVAHKRTDLLPLYVSKMVEAGVHMTAYIANFLIKGYANVGDMRQAREIFESLSNPPSGVAAPNNHAPHTPSDSPTVSVMEPVYREPSTWEVMVRAELGAGNREAALELLERLKERQYPEAVYNRISGVLTDYSSPQQ